MEYKDVDVLTVYPASVRSGMNYHDFKFTVTAEQHAKAVVDALGWESITQGHLNHGF